MKNEYVPSPQLGTIAAAAITATTAATATTVATLGAIKRLIVVTSSLTTTPVTLTINNADFAELPPGVGATFDLGASDLRLPAGATIGVYASTPPAAGRLAVSLL